MFSEGDIRFLALLALIGLCAVVAGAVFAVYWLISHLGWVA